MMNWVAAGVGRKLQVAFILLLLIPSLVIGISSYHTAETRIQGDMDSSIESSTEFLNELINSTIESEMKNVDFLSQSITASLYAGKQSPQLMDMIHRFQNAHPEITSAYVGTETGILISDGNDTLPPDYDPRKRVWYQKAMQNKEKPSISEPYIDITTKAVVVSIAKPVKDGSGVVGIDLNLANLSDIVKRAKVGEQGYAFILDQTKKIIVHPTLKSGDPIQEQTMSTLFKKDAGAYTYIENSQEKETVFTTNKLTGWKIAGTIATAEIENGVQGIFLTTVLTIILSLLLGTVITYWVIQSITKPLKRLSTASEKISNGDLTERVDLKSKDELGQLGSHFNHMSESLQSVIHQVREKVESLAAASEQLMASSYETTKATEHISITVQEIAASSEEETKNVERMSGTITGMSETLQEIAQHTHATSASMAETSDIAAKGNEAIGTAVQQMNFIEGSVSELSHIIGHLHESMEQIDNFAKLITDISSQTNLLALNAAIEAARAGEHGRGFAVVADEVRKLAEQSSNSANSVTELIQLIRGKMETALRSMESSRKEVEKGIDVVTLAGESFTQIYGSINKVNHEVHEVSASVKHITASTAQVVTSIRSVTQTVEQVSAGISEVSASTEEQLASMEEVSATATSLARMAEELEGIVKQFKA
ncbi:methyl-accepting chemotaxis protein [Aneurinibacillus migulanus]|uniref:methyl-accepting chemotaxis protein n=1 Tax=Aneurinibacillus migulanus TaxID=47500 RepID=UPI00209EC4A7|nr:methyl-accepting chemotaxis protein [Aneurinibacillus migulanus]MCP1354590.1 methyl-accepting chemotaxis protein [Aneurinibacillus migulanus]